MEDAFSVACQLLWIDATASRDGELSIGYLAGAFAIPEEKASETLRHYMAARPGRLIRDEVNQTWVATKGVAPLWPDAAHSSILEAMHYVDILVWQDGKRIEDGSFGNWFTKSLADACELTTLPANVIPTQGDA